MKRLRKYRKFKEQKPQAAWQHEQKVRKLTEATLQYGYEALQWARHEAGPVWDPTNSLVNRNVVVSDYTRHDMARELQYVGERFDSLFMYHHATGTRWVEPKMRDSPYEGGHGAFVCTDELQKMAQDSLKDLDADIVKFRRPDTDSADICYKWARMFETLSSACSEKRYWHGRSRQTCRPRSTMGMHSRPRSTIGMHSYLTAH